MQAKARGELRLPHLPTKATIAHKMPVAQNLLSLSVQADNNMISILDKKKIIICKEDTVQITLTEPPVITGRRASNGLWKVPIVASPPRITLATARQPKIEDFTIPTFDHTSLFSLPLTAAWSKHDEQEHLAEPPVYCAWTAYTQPTLEALAIYLHSCAGWPVTETWCAAIANGNYSSWPHLSKFTGPTWIRKHLPKSRETTMGHMKAIRSNTRPTTRSTTKAKNNDEKDITKDEDDGSVPVLAPPRTQLERQKGHHIAFGLIDLSKEKELKGLVSTDLPGRFPFTSSKGNNYIMCMYDYDSNVI